MKAIYLEGLFYLVSINIYSFLDDLISKGLAAYGSKIFFYVLFCMPPFLYTVIIPRYRYNIKPFFAFLFTNREYNSGYFRTTPCFCLRIVNNLQNTKYTKYKIFRQLQNTKYKIYFLY